MADSLDPAFIDGSMVEPDYTHTTMEDQVVPGLPWPRAMPEMLAAPLPTPARFALPDPPGAASAG